jgi:folate-binding protein YgfZ
MQRLQKRAVLRLSGPDTLTLLERTVTHPVSDWDEGMARYGALLTPQGKVITDYIAQPSAEGVLIDAPAGAATDLLRRLSLFRLRAQVDITPAEELCVAITPEGFADPRHAGLPRRAFLPAANAPEVFAGWDALAIRTGVAEWGRDFGSAEVFPTDVNMDLMGAIDYRKGCFVGQEVASRMKRKGGIRKRLLKVRGEALSAGGEVMAGGPIGRITSVAGEHGLAIIRIDRYLPALRGGEAFTVNQSPVEIDTPDWFVNDIEAVFMPNDHD